MILKGFLARIFGDHDVSKQLYCAMTLPVNTINRVILKKSILLCDTDSELFVN